jgi:hypothetical protein
MGGEVTYTMREAMCYFAATLLEIDGKIIGGDRAVV